MKTSFTPQFSYKHLILLLGILIIHTVYSQAQVEWIRYTTDSPGGSGKAIPNDMARDDMGNLYLTGHYDGSPMFDDTTVLGLRDPIFLAKYQADGGLTWVNQIGGNSNNEGTAVAVNDSGHVYFAGTYAHTNANTILDFGDFTMTGNNEESLFFAKADADGTFLWAVNILVDDLLGPDQIVLPRDMIVDQQGDIYLTGEMKGSIQIEGNPYNTDPDDVDSKMLFLAKYAPNGNLIWFKQSTSQVNTGFAQGRELNLASNNDLFLSGYYNNVLFDGAALPDVSQESAEKFIARLDPNGNLLWHQSMSTRLENQDAFQIGVDQNDNVYSLLRISSNIYLEDTTILFPYDFQSPYLLAKWDGNGNRQFLRETAFPNANGSFGLDNLNLATQADGTTYVSGNAIAFADYLTVGNDSLYLKDVPNSFNPTTFITAFNENGFATGVENFVDEYLGNAFTYEVESSTLLAADGKVWMSGFLRGEYRFGNDTVLVSSADQLFLIEIDDAFLNASTAIETMAPQLAFEMYPNPARESVWIRSAQQGNPTQALKLELIDLQGRVLLQQSITSMLTQLDLKSIPSACYLLKVSDGEATYVRRLLVQ